MRYLSVCSGIEAATVAWHSLGWTPVAFSEIDRFPSAVLAHHYPGVPNWGDLTQHGAWPNVPVDLVVGGTPCQSFSVAGLRAGLDDPRGNLALTFLAVVDQYRPRWVVWENVPGVLSSSRGRDFGAFVGALGELGYGWAYRVLDAQYFRVAQRRRRVFVVGYRGDWHRAAAVLFESESLSGHPAPRRETRQVAPTLSSRRTAGGGLGGDFDYDGGLIAGAVTSKWAKGSGGPAGDECYNMVAAPAIQAFDWQTGGDMRGADPKPTAQLQSCQVPAIAFDLAQITSAANRTRVAPDLPASTLNAKGQMHCATSMAVRRLTPRECERLQGFPDDYTLIPYRNKPAADGPRYKALGNSMAVPVMRWIGERLEYTAHIGALDNPPRADR